jgi:hypothetical protein
MRIVFSGTSPTCGVQRPAGGWGIALVFAWQYRVGRVRGCRLTGGFGTASPPWAHRVSAVFGEVAQAPHGEIMPATEVFGDDDPGP